MKRATLILGLATLGVLLIGSGSAVQAAGSATDTLKVGTSIVKNCTITTAEVKFDPYDPVVKHATAPDDSSSGSLTVACTKGATVTIGLGQGANYSANNRMTDGAGNYLEYTLFQDKDFKKAWGTNAAAMSVTTTKKDPAVYPVFARIAAGLDSPEGTYADTVVATVNF